MRLVSVIGFAMAGAVVVAGCSAEEPRSAGPTTTSAQPPPLTIPSVAHPLGVNAFAADSCGLLDESQRAELGLTPVDRGDGAGRNACDLDTDDGRESYLRLVIFDNSGLGDQYAQCGTLDCSQWTMGSIDGYPVIRASDEMISKYGSCKLFLGVADDAAVVVIDVQVDPSADGPECDRADRVASMALATLSR